MIYIVINIDGVTTYEGANIELALAAQDVFYADGHMATLEPGPDGATIVREIEARPMFAELI